MASPSARTDRLSDLPDDVLGQVLSNLPNKAAGRAAALSRRWRHIFSTVDTVSFEEQDGARAADPRHFPRDAKEKKSRSAPLLDDVWSALLCRRTGAGAHVPLRRFRVAFDNCDGWNMWHVDQWLSYVLRHSRKELHLDLRFRLGPICTNSYERQTQSEWYNLPRNLFSCMAMRSLCLSYCGLNLPAAINLPFLEMLSLTGVDHVDSGSSIQRLIASCPRLVDLTLEANNKLEKVSVRDIRLRRFNLRCCHNVKTVDIDVSELRSLNYSGTVPPKSCMSLHGSPQKIIPSCTVDFCKVGSLGMEEQARIINFFENISDTKRLHLRSRHALFGYDFQGFPLFPYLTRLELQGCIHKPKAVRAILEQTPNLEVLSLLMEPPVVLCSKLEPPAEATFSVPCLRHGVREINLIHYQGDELQSMVARLLLRNALVLERLCVVLVKGSFHTQAVRKKEIERCIVAANVQKFFL